MFAGIGGFTLGLERAGFQTVAFCEIDPYCQKVLRKAWPGVPLYDDVRQITANRLISDGIAVDVITGGFPCQDLSAAGKQAGIEGERSGLWSECARLIGELRPRYAIFENVTNLLNGERGAWFQRVLGDISALGYDAEWHCIPASELGAHHHRDRVWILAYPTGTRGEAWSADGMGNDDRPCGNPGKLKSASEQADVLLEDAGLEQRRIAESVSRRQALQGKRPRHTDTTVRPSKNVANASSQPLPRCTTESILWQSDLQAEFRRSREDQRSMWAVEPDVGRVAHGIPQRSHRLKALGNAVVPQIPEAIGKAIMEGHYETSTK